MKRLLFFTFLMSLSFPVVLAQNSNVEYYGSAESGDVVYCCAYDGFTNIREEPSYQAAVIGQFRNGESGAVVLTNLGEWMHVNVHGVVGYVASRYVQDYPTIAYTGSAAAKDIAGIYYLPEDNFFIFDYGYWFSFSIYGDYPNNIGYYIMQNNEIKLMIAAKWTGQVDNMGEPIYKPLKEEYVTLNIDNLDGDTREEFISEYEKESNSNRWQCTPEDFKAHFKNTLNTVRESVKAYNRTASESTYNYESTDRTQEEVMLVEDATAVEYDAVPEVYYSYGDDGNDNDNNNVNYGFVIVILAGVIVVFIIVIMLIVKVVGRKKTGAGNGEKVLKNKELNKAPVSGGIGKVNAPIMDKSPNSAVKPKGTGDKVNIPTPSNGQSSVVKDNGTVNRVNTPIPNRGNASRVDINILGKVYPNAKDKVITKLQATYGDGLIPTSVVVVFTTQAVRIYEDNGAIKKKFGLDFDESLLHNIPLDDITAVYKKKNLSGDYIFYIATATANHPIYLETERYRFFVKLSSVLKLDGVMYNVALAPDEKMISVANGNFKNSPCTIYLTDKRILITKISGLGRLSGAGKAEGTELVAVLDRNSITIREKLGTYNADYIITCGSAIYAISFSKVVPKEFLALVPGAVGNKELLDKKKSHKKTGLAVVSIATSLLGASLGDDDDDYDDDDEVDDAEVDDDGEMDVEAADVDGDGDIDAVGADTDGDGHVDTVVADTDGDGSLDSVVADVDGDGNFDTVAMDADGDGALDTIAVDGDNDGQLDAIAVDSNGDGIADCAGYDTNGDGYVDYVETAAEPDVTAVDIDGDGDIDAVGADTDGDGAVDTMAVDSDNDGQLDTVVVDSNGDGVADCAGYDTNGDGFVDTIVVDSDNDGQLDAIAVDSNGDGILDVVDCDLNSAHTHR